ncbi:uncharacterized protein [Blastocystis hominis]|uniref:Uncharacterized protein n=1 Tax=Blastocystis hominis TaxID=12968 RepID=D8M1J1_BLAHO|nr:uncharacterized protein [Blastocystis hominis]CBK21930.2 unnamed protein product [Blastocystis hominis]|eukprot:XP_012895978.1 uncharacterized protein [Blastocystis hominis]
MSARCLLVALFCFSAAVAYGPAMILSHVESADEVYINRIIDYSDLEPLIPIEEMNLLFVDVNITDALSVKEIQPFVQKFESRIIAPHFEGELNATDIMHLDSVEGWLFYILLFLTRRSPLSGNRQ